MPNIENATIRVGAAIGVIAVIVGLTVTATQSVGTFQQNLLAQANQQTQAVSELTSQVAQLAATVEAVGARQDRASAAYADRFEEINKTLAGISSAIGGLQVRVTQLEEWQKGINQLADSRDARLRAVEAAVPGIMARLDSIAQSMSRIDTKLGEQAPKGAK